MTSEACLLCRRAATMELGISGSGWLLRGGYWGVSAHPAMPVPGWIAVQTLRHTEGLARLNRAEADELGPLLVRLSAAVTRLTRAERIYSYSLGERVPHTHILLGPPSRKISGAKFLSALLCRDQAIVDEAAAAAVADELARELAGPPNHDPTEESSETHDTDG